MSRKAPALATGYEPREARSTYHRRFISYLTLWLIALGLVIGTLCLILTKGSP